MKNIKETVMKYVFLVCACVSILAVVLICVFLFANGIPAIGKIGVFDFLLGERWKPGNNIYGILPFILGSIYVTAGAVLIGVPIGICTAVFMAKFCPPKLYKFMKPAVELLAGIPSVVYGFFGMVVVVPFVRDFFGIQLGFGGDGSSMFTAHNVASFCLSIISASRADRSVFSKWYGTICGSRELSAAACSMRRKWASTDS